MTLKKTFSLLSFILFSTTLFASDVPIIFVHGHKSEARPLMWDTDKQQYVGGWSTWYPINPNGSLKYPTAMTKIIDSHYGSYQYGITSDSLPAKFCDKTTQLQPDQGTKRIFNFSFYRSDGGRGVIALSEEKVKVYFAYDDSGQRVPIYPY